MNRKMIIVLIVIVIAVVALIMVKQKQNNIPEVTTSTVLEESTVTPDVNIATGNENVTADEKVETKNVETKKSIEKAATEDKKIK
jgi:CDP-diacylglycerol pyrophosphatase